MASTRLFRPIFRASHDEAVFLYAWAISHSRFWGQQNAHASFAAKSPLCRFQTQMITPSAYIIIAACLRFPPPFHIAPADAEWAACTFHGATRILSQCAFMPSGLRQQPPFLDAAIFAEGTPPRVGASLSSTPQKFHERQRAIADDWLHLISIVDTLFSCQYADGWKLQLLRLCVIVVLNYCSKMPAPRKASRKHYSWQLLAAAAGSLHARIIASSGACATRSARCGEQRIDTKSAIRWGQPMPWMNGLRLPSSSPPEQEPMVPPRQLEQKRRRRNIFSQISRSQSRLFRRSHASPPSLV